MPLFPPFSVQYFMWYFLTIQPQTPHGSEDKIIRKKNKTNCLVNTQTGICRVSIRIWPLCFPKVGATAQPSVLLALCELQCWLRLVWGSCEVGSPGRGDRPASCDPAEGKDIIKSKNSIYVSPTTVLLPCGVECGLGKKSQFPY